MPEVAFVEFPPKKSIPEVSGAIHIVKTEMQWITHCSCREGEHCPPRGKWCEQHSSPILYTHASVAVSPGLRMGWEMLTATAHDNHSWSHDEGMCLYPKRRLKTQKGKEKG